MLLCSPGLLRPYFTYPILSPWFSYSVLLDFFLPFWLLCHYFLFLLPIKLTKLIKFNYDAKWCSGHFHTLCVFKKKNNGADNLATELDDSRNSCPSSIIFLLEVCFNAKLCLWNITFYIIYNFEKLEMKI